MEKSIKSFRISLLILLLLIITQISYPFHTQADSLEEIEEKNRIEELDTYQEQRQEEESNQQQVEKDLLPDENPPLDKEDKVMESNETEDAKEPSIGDVENEKVATEETQTEEESNSEVEGEQKESEKSNLYDEMDEDRKDSLESSTNEKDTIEDDSTTEKPLDNEECLEKNTEEDQVETEVHSQKYTEKDQDETGVTSNETNVEEQETDNQGEQSKPSLSAQQTNLVATTLASSTTPPDYFKVTTDNLTVYDNRGDGPLKAVGKLKEGQVYSIVSDYGNWWRVQFGDIYGYVRKSDTVIGNDSEVKNWNTSYSDTEHKYKANQNVTIYDNTSGSLVPFGELNKGNVFPIATDYGNWWRVIFLDRVGYVRKSEGDLQYADFQNYFKADKNLPIYDNRDSGPLKKVGEVQKGQVYKRVSDSGNWHRLQFGDYYGYVEKFETTPDKGSSIRNENRSYTNTEHKFKAHQNVTVYDNTSGKLVPFGMLSRGTVFPIVSDYTNWWRIDLADRIGYIRKNEGELQHASFNSHFKADQSAAIYDNRGSGPLKKVGEVVAGQEYSIVSDYGNWHRINFGDIYGYVKKIETSPSNGNTIHNENENYTNSTRSMETLQRATVYDNTGGSLVAFGTIDKGTIFPLATDYGKWWRIVFADRVGYVNKDAVKAEFKTGDEYFRVMESNLPVYDNRSSGPLEKIGSLQKGQVFSIISDYGNWWRVQFGDTYGYVKKSDTGYATGSEINNLNTSYKNSVNKFIPKHSVTVYDNTSGKLVAMGEIDKDIPYSIASDYGNWWRVIYLDRVGYVNKADVDVYGISRTSYNLTLEEALAMQMNVSPQTDSRYAYISKSYIKNNRVTAYSLNVRSGPGVNNSIVGQLTNGDKVNVLGDYGNWYQIEYPHRGWVNASAEETLYYLDPNNFINNSKQQYQFLDLSKTSDASVTELNSYLSGKGTLAGQGQAFKEASRVHGINDIYLISHAILETGHGSSTLAQGVNYNGVTVYNMFGVGAYDNCAVECGARRAYEEGWTTPHKAIVGGSAFIGNNYIKAGQNTLYKMRWNPEGMERYGYATHQYATDIGWASKQINAMYNLYQSLGLKSIYLDVPIYKM